MARRRAPTAVAAALLLAVAPAAAQAAFSSTVSASLTAATAQLTAPSSVTAAITCTGSNGKSAKANVTAYTAVPHATGYKFVLTAPDGTSTSATVGAPIAGVVQLPPALTDSAGSPGSRIHTLTVQATAGSWLGTAWTQTHQC
jgi:hypothetical protein